MNETAALHPDLELGRAGGTGAASDGYGVSASPGP